MSAAKTKAARLLWTARRRAGFTQRELARKAGVPQPTVSRIERGVVSPTVDTLNKLVRACGMDLEVLDHPGAGVDVTLIAERLDQPAPQRLRDIAHGAEVLQQIARARERNRAAS